MTEDKLEQLRELYKGTYGRYPSPNAKPETLIARLETEGEDVSMFKEEDVAEAFKEEPEAKEPEAKEPETKEPDAPVNPPKVEDQPLSMGQGVKTRFLVYFRGKPRYWTKASIQVMSSSSKDIKFPEGTPFDGAASFHKCKNC